MNETDRSIMGGISYCLENPSEFRSMMYNRLQGVSKKVNPSIPDKKKSTLRLIAVDNQYWD